MGQYYKAVIISKNEIKIVDSWSHKNGAKLMEHSYYGNELLNSVLGVCKDKAVFRLGWVGDYSDEEKEFEEDWKNNLHKMAYIAAWREIEDESPYNNADRLFREKAPADLGITQDVWVCNADKMQAVLHRFEPLESGIHISPFPLLCAVGNDRGGGDYHAGTNKFMVGSWAYDRLFITHGGCPKGYMEIPEDVFVEKY